MSGDSSVLPGSTQAAALLRAMGHTARLEILCLLQDGEMTMSDLARRLAMRSPAVSQQLAASGANGWSLAGAVARIFSIRMRRT
jgi:DNA-binding transcriptional ArsR family regulator